MHGQPGCKSSVGVSKGLQLLCRAAAFRLTPVLVSMSISGRSDLFESRIDLDFSF